MPGHFTARAPASAKRRHAWPRRRRNTTPLFFFAFQMRAMRGYALFRDCQVID